MKSPLTALILTLVVVAAAARADWEKVAPGVDFQEFKEGTMDVFVTRIDLTNPALAVISSREVDRATRVTDFAKRTQAVAAINGDYFDDQFKPVGLTLTECGSWIERAPSKRKEAFIAIGAGKAELEKSADLGDDETPADWAKEGISGWPVLVDDCTPLSATQLPGSDSFTRSPHPRTAIGISKNGSTMYLVAADGRRTGVPGLTLAELATFMSDRLHACSAVNLDGGGSTAMAVRGQLVNRPSDGFERKVSNHLAVAMTRDLPACSTAPAPLTASTPSTGTAPATSTSSSASSQSSPSPSPTPAPPLPGSVAPPGVRPPAYPAPAPATPPPAPPSRLR
jgi:exopolysaccharide biosynthesis protein